MMLMDSVTTTENNDVPTLWRYHVLIIKVDILEGIKALVWKDVL